MIQRCISVFFKDRTLFLSTAIAWMLVTLSPVLHESLGTYTKILLIWGFVLIVYDCVTGRVMARHRYGLLLVGFLLSYGISILLNLGGGLYGNLRNFSYMVLFFFVFYGYNTATALPDRQKQFRLLAGIVSAATGILSAVCFVTYLAQFNRVFRTADNVAVHIGMYDNRLWGLYNPNTGGTVAVIAILLSLYFLATTDRRWVKALHIVNIVIQFCVRSLGQSRSSQLGLAAAVAIFAFFMLPYRFARLGGGSRRAWFARGLIAVAVCGFSIGLVKPLNDGLAYLPGSIKIMLSGEWWGGETSGDVSDVSGEDSSADVSGDTSGDETSDPEESKPEKEPPIIDPIDLDRVDAGSELSNGRFELWRAGLAALKDAPLFGYTSENIPTVVVRYFTDKTPDFLYNALRIGGLHNLYLTVLVSSGIVGFLLIGTFVAGCMIALFRLLFRLEKKRSAWMPIPATVLAVLAALLIMDFFEARLLYTTNVFSALFFALLGFGMYYVDKDTEADGRDRTATCAWTRLEDGIARRLPRRSK